MAAWETFFEAIVAGDAIITTGNKGRRYSDDTEVHHTVVKALLERVGVVDPATQKPILRVAPITDGVVICGPKSDMEELVAEANTERRRAMGRTACDRVTAMATEAKWAAAFVGDRDPEVVQAAKLNAEFVAGTSPAEWISGFTRWDVEGLVWVLDIPGTYEACLDRIEQSSGGPL